MNAALLVIDFQNAVFLAPPAANALQVQERIRHLIGEARAVGAPVVYVQHEERGTAWEAGSETWRFPDAIAPREGDYVSPKCASDAFVGSALASHLSDQRIERVFVCGYATEFCIDTNVRRAASLGIETIVVEDAHTTRDRPHLAANSIVEHHNWIWREFSSPGKPIRLVPFASVDFGRA